MTRQQYQAKYGALPSTPSVTPEATSGTPVKMTRAEYQAQYGEAPTITPPKPITPTPEKKPGLLQRFGESLISSERGFAESAVKAFGPSGEEEILSTTESAGKLIESAKKLPLGDPRRKQLLEQANQLSQQASSQAQERIEELPSNKQVIGQAAGVATDIISAGAIPGVAGKVITAPATLKQGLLMGAKEGAKVGAIVGGAKSASGALEEDKSLPEVAVEGLKGAAIGGLAGGALGAAAGGISGARQGRIDRKQEVLEMLQKRKPQVEAVGYKISPEKEVIKDKVAQKAISVGISDTDVNFIKNSTRGDKALFRNQYKIAEAVSKDKTNPSRPVEVAGKALVDRVKFLMNKRTEVGKQIGEAVKNLPDEKLNTQPVYDEFLKDIQEAGVRRTTSNALNFSQSAWRNQPQVRKAVQQLYNDLQPSKITGTSEVKALRLYRLRQQLFDDLNIASKTNVLPDNATRILSKTRGNLEKPLLEVSGDYKKLATDYSKLSQSVSEFNKIMGKDFNIADDLAALRAGEVGNRILGNASAKPLKLLQLIDDTSKDFKFFSNVDLRNQFLFSDFLEDIFGTTQTRSLRGQVGKGVGDAEEAIQIAGQAVTGNIPGTVVGLAKKGLNLVRGITPENQKRAVKELIELLR